MALIWDIASGGWLETESISPAQRITCMSCDFSLYFPFTIYGLNGHFLEFSHVISPSVSPDEKFFLRELSESCLRP